MKVLLLAIPSLIGLFLSTWIVLLAPADVWLPLSVGAPEVSPWLMLVNAVVLLLALLGKRQGWMLGVIAASSLALLLSSWPLLQFPHTLHATQQAMQQSLGSQYLDTIPETQQRQMRPHPYSIAVSFLGIPLPAVRHRSQVRFAQPDGVPLEMEVFQPPKAGRYPGLVVIYGGAWQRGDPTANAAFNRHMAAQGYVVWSIDYRHAPQYQFPSQFEDVKTALDFIEKHADDYETDPQRLAIMGRSAGAQLAMLAAYSGDTLRAVINYYGPVDLSAGYANPPNPDPIDTRAVLRDFLGGSPAEVPERYRQASPLTYVVGPLPPTLLIYGSRDRIVKASYGQALYQQLIRTGSQAVYLEIPWADHAFDAVFNGVSNQLALFHTERFLSAVLRDPSGGQN